MKLPAAACWLAASIAACALDLPIAEGPFRPSLSSLSAYQCPDWFRDAKFGIWAHWGPQCEPEDGDWYARNMYIQGHRNYQTHTNVYGHPSEFGFKDVCHVWKADQFDPERLVALYKRAGAQYFVAMANHHDNFDLWDSNHQPWNSVKIGPKKDLIGLWEKAARQAGLRFGVTVHAARAWEWFEASQLSDTNGPKAGVPYDGNLTAADGKGKGCSTSSAASPGAWTGGPGRPTPASGPGITSDRSTRSMATGRWRRWCTR